MPMNVYRIHGGGGGGKQQQPRKGPSTVGEEILLGERMAPHAAGGCQGWEKGGCGNDRGQSQSWWEAAKRPCLPAGRTAAAPS